MTYNSCESFFFASFTINCLKRNRQCVLYFGSKKADNSIVLSMNTYWSYNTNVANRVHVFFGRISSSFFHLIFSKCTFRSFRFSNVSTNAANEWKNERVKYERMSLWKYFKITVAEKNGGKRSETTLFRSFSNLWLLELSRSLKIERLQENIRVPINFCTWF